jgi:5'-phosphate synthase pdxT subunit
MVKVGVLALQGDFLEHYELLKEIGVEVAYVKKSSDLQYIDALVIPGGESTTIGSLILYRGLTPAIKEFAEAGRPILGTCAGAILLAKKVADRVVGETDQFTLELMNISVLRNAFGRQVNSFEAIVFVEGVGDVRGMFIRAPAIVEAWPPAKITGYVEHPVVGKVGAVAQQDNLLALAFHPELSCEKKVYEYFLAQAKK